MMLILIFLLTQHYLTLVYSCGKDIINNLTIWCHLDQDGFIFEYGFSQGFLLMSSQGVFPCQLCLWLAY